MHNNCVIDFTVFPHKNSNISLTLSLAIPSHDHCLSHRLLLKMWVGRMSVVEHSWELAICCLSNSKLCGRESRTAHGRKSKVDTHTHTKRAESRSFFLESDISGCRSNFLFSSSLHLYSFFSAERSLMMSLVTRAG